MNVKYSPKDIFEQDFKTAMRGYDRSEVDSFLDEVIKDYESFAAEIERLQAEIASLKKERANSQASQSSTPAYKGSSLFSEPRTSVAPRMSHAANTATNLDILKRISRLEKEVFGKQIRE